jgi:hypothetical protein
MFYRKAGEGFFPARAGAMKNGIGSDTISQVPPRAATHGLPTARKAAAGTKGR